MKGRVDEEGCNCTQASNKKKTSDSRQRDEIIIIFHTDHIQDSNEKSVYLNIKC